MTAPRQTRDEWLAGYAARERVSVVDLLIDRAKRGQEVRPCDCDYRLCTGWAWEWTRDDV